MSLSILDMCVVDLPARWGKGVGGAGGPIRDIFGYRRTPGKLSTTTVFVRVHTQYTL